MWLRKSLAVLACTLVLPSPLFAQTGMTDLIPHRAGAALTIRNLQELKKKGDQFAKECDLNLGLRPSDLFTMAYQFLGLQGGIDESGPAAIILMAPEKKDEAMEAPLNTGRHPCRCPWSQRRAKQPGPGSKTARSS